MGEIKITEMDADDAIGGSEAIPVSDAGSPKRITPAQIAAYVIDLIEAISATGSTTGADSLFLLQGGSLKPIDIDVVVQYVLTSAWAKAAEASPADADTLQMYDADEGAENTVTMANVATYVKTKIEAAILDISDLADGSGAIATTDYMLVTQGTTGKRIQISDLNTLIYASLATHVSDLSAVTAGADADVMYVLQSGTAKKITLAQIATYLGNPPSAPETTTVNKIPQWSDIYGTLKDGLSKDTTVGDVADDESVPSTKAVRAALDTPEYLWVPAKAMTPSTTAGCGTETKEYATNDNNHYVMLFDGLAQNETAEFDVVFPNGWDADSVRMKVYWAPGNAAANADEWVRFMVSARAYGEDEAFDQAMGNAINIDDQAIADDDLHVTDASDPIIIAGTPAREELVHFKITRDYDYDGGTGVAMDVDARVFGVLIEYTRETPAVAWS